MNYELESVSLFLMVN